MSAEHSLKVGDTIKCSSGDEVISLRTALKWEGYRTTSHDNVITVVGIANKKRGKKRGKVLRNDRSL